MRCDPQTRPGPGSIGPGVDLGGFYIDPCSRYLPHGVLCGALLYPKATASCEIAVVARLPNSWEKRTLHSAPMAPSTGGNQLTTTSKEEAAPHIEHIADSDDAPDVKFKLDFKLVMASLVSVAKFISLALGGLLTV